ncbi:hypothetical protein V8E53_004041 [Lactarius tabidus]
MTQHSNLLMILFFAVIGYLSSTFLLPPPTTYCILLTIRQLHPHSRTKKLRNTLFWLNELGSQSRNWLISTKTPGLTSLTVRTFL